MKTSIIIDDEKNGRIALREKLSMYCPQVEVLGEAANGEEGLLLIERYHPDIIFLDIEMPIMDGFSMLNHVEKQDFHLIFTTAYDHYAIKAIKYAAFDYLLKPVDIEELKTTIRKATQSKPLSNSSKLHALNKNLEGQHEMRRIAIPTLEEFVFFDINQILHLEAHGNYTKIYSSDNVNLLACRTLKEFEELLPSEYFVRIHHSHIINIHFVKKFIKTDGGQIQLNNNQLVPVSRRKKKDLMKYFEVL